jgi:demethylmenaquinone methyltransferase/2-methoxy-6-polyprenyl-1,4-benzoquinol methylase
VLSRRVGRYTFRARVYDVVSFEWPVYRPGRRAGLALLGLRPGDVVLDVGCGTGLDFALLEAAVGPAGLIIGVDVSSSMLARAVTRVRRGGWDNVRLVRADAARADLAGLAGPGGADAVVFAYSLSVIRRGSAAWAAALVATRPGGRVAVVDTAMPTGRWAWQTPLARLACTAGGVDLRRETWRWVARDTTDVVQRVLRGGHIRLAAGTVPAGRDAAADR